jgi:hypothetical protein
MLSGGIKRPYREADDSPPSSAEIKNEWTYISTPSIRLCGVDRDNFAFRPRCGPTAAKYVTFARRTCWVKRGEGGVD